MMRSGLGHVGAYVAEVVRIREADLAARRDSAPYYATCVPPLGETFIEEVRPVTA